MPHRRPKHSVVLGAVAALAVASPFAVYGVSTSRSDIRPAGETNASVVAPQIAEVVLASVPDIVIPVKDLTGLDLPDISLRQLAAGLPDLTNPGTPTPPTQSAPPAGRSGSSLTDQAGAIVKEITRDDPFSMIALASNEHTDMDARVRAQHDDGSWGPWFTSETIETARTDVSADGRAGTEPVYVGLTRAVQVLLTPRPEAEPLFAGAEAPQGEAPAPAPAAGAPAAEAPTPVPATADGAPVSYTPASANTPLRAQDPAQRAADVSAVLINPGDSANDGALSDIAQPIGGNGPRVISRAEWGADESIRCEDPTIDDSLGGATVHHTDGSNDYTKAESAGIVRAIYAYHAQTLGWCDVGYNVLVDRYGQIFEGRAGGLDRNVQGAHAGGFNENTMGIAMMGDFSTEAPPEPTLQAVGDYLGWRLNKAGLDPLGKTTMYSEGTDFTPYPQGAAVDLPVIFAHRDVGSTACPGDAGYARMGEIRQLAAVAARKYASGGGGSPTDHARLATGTPGVPGTTGGTRDAGTAAVAAGTPPPGAGSSGNPIPAIIAELLKPTDENPIAQKWVAEGGETGPLGQATTGVQSGRNDFQFADFTNGSIYASPNGGVWTVLGKIYETWRDSGLDHGQLGLPTSDEYRVPEGMRSDFEFGSLIFNEVTGIVTTVLHTFAQTYGDAMRNPAAAPAEPAPAQEAPAPEAPAPEPEPAP